MFCFVFFEVYLSVPTKIWTSHNQILIKLTRSEANISSNNFRHRNLALSISRAHQYFIPLISLLTFLRPGFLGKKNCNEDLSLLFCDIIVEVSWPGTRSAIQNLIKLTLKRESMTVSVKFFRKPQRNYVAIYSSVRVHSH